MHNKKFKKIVAAVLVACSVVGVSGAVSLSQNETYSYEWKKTYSKHGYPLYNGNKYYFFKSIDAFKLKNLPKSKGGQYINTAMTKKEMAYYPKENKRWLKRRWSNFEREMKEYVKARKKNDYDKLMYFDARIAWNTYLAKYGLQSCGYKLSDGKHDPGVFERRDFYTIEELNYAKKKGYIKKCSLYYGANQLKERQINVGETIVNKPSNMPKTMFMDKEKTHCIGQEWSAATPVYKDGKIVSQKKGSDVVSVDKKTGKVTGLKKGKAVVTVKYGEKLAISCHWVDCWESQREDGTLLWGEYYYNPYESNRYYSREQCEEMDKKALREVEECRKADIVFSRSYVVTVK